MLCAGFTLVETVKRVKNYKGTALGKGDKVVTIMQVKSSIHFKLSIVYLPCMVNQGWFKICRSVGRFIGTTFSNELIKFLASVEMKVINKDCDVTKSR